MMLTINDEVQFLPESETTVETHHLAGLVWRSRVWSGDKIMTKWGKPYPTEQMAIDNGFDRADQVGLP